MSNITVSVPEELKKELDELPEINWSEAVRKFLSEKVKRAMLLKKLDSMLEKSEMTEKDALELGRKIKKGRFEKLRQAGLV